MSELDGTRLKTKDKRLAAELLERCLASNVPLNAEIAHLNGVYSVEVSENRDECADEQIS